jgi:uncharacterized membrane protein YgcG
VPVAAQVPTRALKLTRELRNDLELGWTEPLHFENLVLYNMEQSSSKLSMQQVILEKPLILELILHHAGQRQWLLAGSVNKAWAAMHEALATQPKQTSYAQLVTSLERVQFACACDPRLLQEDQHLLGLSKAAAFSGNGDVLLWAQGVAGPRWSRWLDDLRMAAAAGRQLASFQWLLIPVPNIFNTFRFGGMFERTLVERAATDADLGTLQWLVQTGLSGYQWSNYDVVKVAAAAAEVAAIDVLDWLRTQPVFPVADDEDSDVHNSMAAAAVKSGALPSLQWLAAHGLVFDNPYYPTLAAASRQFAVLQYLVVTAHCPWFPAHVRREALHYCDGQLLQWLWQEGGAWTDEVLRETLFEAGKFSNVAAAEWLIAQGADVWPTSFLYTDQYGKMACWPLRMMQWARARGCPWGAWPQTSCKELCAHNTEGVNEPWLQHTIMWAHAAGCPCDSKLHHFAARRLRAKKSSGASSGSSGGSGGSSSSSSSSEGARWNAKLFKLFYTAGGHTRLKKGVRFTCTAVLAVLCGIVALVASRSALQLQVQPVEAVRSVSGQPVTSSTQQSAAVPVAVADSGLQQYNYKNLEDYSVQQLYAVLRDLTEAAFGSEQAEVGLAPILKVSAEVMVTEVLREVRVDQIKQDSKIIDGWKKRLISLIGLLKNLMNKRSSL